MVLVVPLQAEADEAVDVTWTAPDGCPSSAELRRRVMTRVPGDAAVRARGRVEKRGGGYRITLEIATASSRGERALEASTCEALASSAAVVIAMSVAPPPEDEPSPTTAEATGARSSADAAPDASAAPLPAASSSALSGAASRDRPAGSSSPRANEQRVGFLVRAHVIGDAGLLPSAGVGGGLAFGVVPVRDLVIEASASLFGSQDGAVEGAPGRGASFDLLSAGARACWTLTRGVELAPCLGVELARISASGFGAAKVADAESITWGPEALLAARIPVAGPISVRVGVGGFAPMSRQSFVINAAGTVHQPGAVALRTWAGPEVRF
jgi:hypothetical protein